MGERIDRMKIKAKTYIQSDQVNAVKKHFNDHKVFYAVVGSSAITWLVAKNTQHVLPKDPSIGVLNKPISIFSKGQKTITKIVQVVEREGRGHPGYMTWVPELNQGFKTQLETANAIGVSPTALSNFMTGKLSDVNGMHPQRIPA